MRFTGQPSQPSPRNYHTELDISVEEQGDDQFVHASQTTGLRNCETKGPRHRRKEKSCQQSTKIPAAGNICTRVSLWTSLFVLIFLFNGAVAQERIHPPLRKAAREELQFDLSPAPDSPHRRALVGRAAASTPAAASATGNVVPQTSSENTSGTAVGPGSSAAATSTGIATAPETGTSTLPQPFDTSLGSNFTSTACPTYFNKFLADSVFRTCYPFSLLLQTSHAFFEAEKSYVKTTTALDASCHANFSKCNALMQNIAYKIKQPEVCGNDYTAQNPLVLQAYQGLLSYASMYQAGCLKDSAGSYCFANAITGTNSSLADVYPYWLPLGTDMPSGYRATCTTCMKNTMGIFKTAASNSSLPISKTYVSAAQLINIGCGPQYVSDSVDIRSSSRPTTSPPSITSFVTIFVMLTLAFYS
ncbi:c6 zinc finger domain containing protein [Venturia nashicola]|nr:c6 zinc finger domain containing protein [Venturia nashicola]